MGSFSQIWRNKAKIIEGMKNSLFKKQAVESIAKERMDICEQCPHIDREGTKCMVPGTAPCCGLCGCKLGFKTRSLSSACDDNRWGAVLTDDEQDKLYGDIDYNPDKSE